MKSPKGITVKVVHEPDHERCVAALVAIYDLARQRAREARERCPSQDNPENSGQSPEPASGSGTTGGASTVETRSP